MARSTVPLVICAGLGMAVIGAGTAGADDVDRGELRGAIRAAGHPCANVTAVEAQGSGAWTVTCNSGEYAVKRDRDGAYSVSPKN